MTSPNRGVCVDLFSGFGGLSFGMESGGFDIEAGVDIEPQHSAVHHYNFPYGRSIPGDLSVIRGREIRGTALKDREIDSLVLGRSPDALVGGPPCVGFSSMGKRNVDDPRNALVHHFLRLVNEMQPRYAVMENVEGITTGQYEHLLDELCEEYHKIGYGVVRPIQVLNAAHFGVPQLRKRVFLLIYRYGETPPDYPDPTHTIKEGAEGLTVTPTAGEALSNLPNADDFAELWERDWVDASGHWDGATGRYVMMMRGQWNDPLDLSYPRYFNPALLTSSKRTAHKPHVVERYRNAAPGKAEPVSRFHRIDPHGQSLTLRAGTVTQHGGHTAARPIHPHYPRVITVREGARLHSIPDCIRLHAKPWNGFRELGNSVPPLLGRAIAHEIRKAAGLCPEQPAAMIEPGNPEFLEMNGRQAAKALAA